MQEHLRRVKSGAGHWHELAKLLPVLHAAGFDSVFIEQEAGVERATQNRWTVSMQVGTPCNCACSMPLHCRAMAVSCPHCTVCLPCLSYGPGQHV